MSKLLRIQIYLMALNNKWELDTKSPFLNRLCKIYGVFTECLSHVFVHYLALNLIANRKCPTIFFEIFCYYSHHVIVLILHAFLRKSAVKKSLDCIVNYEKMEYDQEDQDCKDIYDYHVRVNILIDKYIMLTFTLIGCSLWYLLTILHAVRVNNEECPLTPGSFYQIDYPFAGWIIVLIDMYMASLFCCLHVTNRVFPISLVLFQLAQIKILSANIGKVDARAVEIMNTKEVSFEEAVNIAVDDCIRKHQEIIRNMDMFQEATKEMMLIGFFSYAVQLTGFIIQMFTASSPYQALRPLTLSPLDILQILSFFWFANEVFTESMALADDIYHKLQWVNYNKSIRMKLIIMMMRSQKPLCLNGVGIGEMTLEKFKQIMKSCFSLVTFFQTMYQN